jgi:hypothetical protein
MKRNLFLLVAFLPLMALITFSGCKKDDKEVPEFFGLTVAADNATATLAFSGAVYSTEDMTGALTSASVTVTVAGGTATLQNFELAHTAGTAQAVITLVLNGAADGTETITVSPASGSSIFSEEGGAMPADETVTATLNETGAIGYWISAGANVAPVIASLGFDSLTADFRPDNTYTVVAFTPDGSSTTFTGTFVQTKSGTGNIYDIILSQNQPGAVESEGIFEVTGGVETIMKYEVAQTDPSIPGVTPPNAAAGFGSTSGGAFGTGNVQTFVRSW